MTPSYLRHLSVPLMISFLLVVTAACDATSTLVDATPDTAPPPPPATTADSTPLCEDFSNVGLGLSIGLPWDAVSFGAMVFEDATNQCKLRVSLKAGPSGDLLSALQAPSPFSLTVQGAQELSDGTAVQVSGGSVSGTIAGVSGSLDGTCLAGKLATNDTATLNQCASVAGTVPALLTYDATIGEVSAEFPIEPGSPFEVLAPTCQAIDPVCKNLAVNDVLTVECGGSSDSVYKNDNTHYANWQRYRISRSPLQYGTDPGMSAFVPDIVDYDPNTGVFTASPAGDNAANDLLRADADQTDFTPQYTLVLENIDGTGPLEQADIADVRLQYTCPDVRGLAGARIVLEWGDEPRDLDSHLYTPSIEGSTYHVYYASKGSESSAPYVELQNDDTQSSGPETTRFAKAFPGTYTFAVYKYAGEGELTSSSARVRLIRANGDEQSWDVPTTGSGRWWTVFRVDGDTGQVTTVNTIGSAANKSSVTPTQIAPMPKKVALR